MRGRGLPVQLKAMTLGLVLLTAPLLPVAVAEEPTSFADRARALLMAEVQAYGLDPQVFLDAPLEFEVPQADGSTRTFTITVADALARFDGPVVDAGGVAGTPELTVGDVVHLYLNIRFGNARAYQVSQSALVPSTPFVPVPPVFIEYGGPVKNVKGSYLIGVHTVGTVVGSNVDTAASGPYLPLVHAGLVADRKIDFVGHGIPREAQFCFFGLCVAIGLLLGDGVIAWDTNAVDFPRVP